MSIKIGKYYITKNQPRELLKTIAILQQENQELKKKLNEAVHKATEYESNVYELKNQQKEFIEYLKNKEKEFENEEKYLYKKRVPKFYEVGKVKGSLYVLRSVLSKYKEIIGDRE